MLVKTLDDSTTVEWLLLGNIETDDWMLDD